MPGWPLTITPLWATILCKQSRWGDRAPQWEQPAHSTGADAEKTCLRSLQQGERQSAGPCTALWGSGEASGWGGKLPLWQQRGWKPVELQFQGCDHRQVQGSEWVVETPLPGNQQWCHEAATLRPIDNCTDTVTKLCPSRNWRMVSLKSL